MLTQSFRIMMMMILKLENFSCSGLEFIVLANTAPGWHLETQHLKITLQDIQIFCD